MVWCWLARQQVPIGPVLPYAVGSTQTMRSKLVPVVAELPLVLLQPLVVVDY